MELFNIYIILQPDALTCNVDLNPSYKAFLLVETLNFPEIFEARVGRAAHFVQPYAFAPPCLLQTTEMP